MSDQERLQKVLAHAGIASRRASEELILEGRVTVDGEVAELGMKVDPTRADIRVDGERINADPDRVYVLLNKPQGVVTTMDDPEGRPTVADLVNLDQRLFPVGRLDMDTEGLLLLTNDGDLAHALLHPSFEVERTYLALVPGPVRKKTMADLRAGVELEDGFARPRRIRQLEEARSKVLLEITMTEGRKREVRRMLDAVGLTCERLARVSYGGVELGELRQGKWRFLTQREIGALHAAVGEGRRRRRDPRKVSRDERRRRGGPEGTPGGGSRGGGDREVRS
ncbi:MAG: pseudouridine synthase [Actinomycetes bacterium]